MKKIVPALLFIAIANAHATNDEQFDDGPKGVFVFENGYEANPKGDGPHWIEVKGGKWHLNDGELATMQQKLRQFFEGPQGTSPSPSSNEPFDIRKAAKATGDKGKILAAWPTYSIQYQGQHTFEGQYVKIEANCMFSERDLAWLHETFAMVSDGGTCVFNVKYNPVTQQFFDFTINGYA